MRAKSIIGIVLFLALVSSIRLGFSGRALPANAGVERAEVTVDFTASTAPTILFKPNEGLDCTMYTGVAEGGMRIWGVDKSGTKQYEVIAKPDRTSDGRIQGRIQLTTQVPVKLDVKGIINPRMEGGLGWLELPVELPPGAYNLRVTPLPPSAFVLQWRAGQDAPYSAYQVTSDEGMKRIREWVRAHDEQMQKGARLPPMSIMPNVYFWEVRNNGAREEIPLIFSYPADFSIPKGLRGESIVNLTDADFDALKRIFTESGVAIIADEVP